MDKIKRIFIVLLISSFACISYAATPPRQDQPSKKEMTLDPEQVKKFGLAVAQIKRLHVNHVDDNEIFANAIRGMLAGLDPHSAYLDEEDMKNLEMNTSGEFIGLGMELTMDKGLLKVISPIDDTPASKAGIKAGDYILAVDNHPIIKTSLNKAIDMLRGKPNTTVILTIVNKSDKKPKKITIERALIKIKSVKSRLLPDGFGYIRISQFQDKTAAAVVNAIAKLNQEAGGHIKGLIVDLRNNPGGLLEAAIEVSDIFLDSQKLGNNKKIVSTKGQISKMNMSADAHRGDALFGAPLVILINKGSASASEIVAGALQDHKRAIITGEKSFGKGSVQSVLPLDKKTGVKLTTALYYTPKDRSIQAEGITPDLLIENLDIPDEQEDILFLSEIRESDLIGHLANGNNRAEEKISPKQALKKLAQEDYQLYSALNTLKSMHLLARQQSG